MDLGLKDKVAIVGGASKGLGRACAEVLAEEGAKVAMCSRTRDDLERAADEIRGRVGADVVTFAGDLDQHDTIRNLVSTTVSRYGRLDILVNNSGGPPLARAASATEEQWATAVQRSLLFFARMSREALPHLKRQGGGRIINILASTVYQPIPNLALSGATRMGVVAFAKSLADEVGRDGILVNNVCPGSLLSERMLSNVTARSKELGISVEEALAQRAAETAVGRVGEPRELAYLVAFLASDRSSYITGTPRHDVPVRVEVVVDGGGVDRDVGMMAVEGGQPLGTRQQADELDRARVRVPQTVHGRHRGVAGGQHGVDDDRVTALHLLRHLEVVLDGDQRLGIAIQAHVTDPCAGQQAEHAVQDADARPQDRDQHDLLAVQHGRGHAGQRRVDGHRVRAHVPRHLVGQQHADLGEEIAERRCARALHAHQAELVLYQRMVDDVNLTRHEHGLLRLRSARMARHITVPSLSTLMGGAPSRR